MNEAAYIRNEQDWGVNKIEDENRIRVIRSRLLEAIENKTAK